jgi:hypothetical protein
MVKKTYRPFPTDCFPDQLRDVLFEVQLAYQCPIELPVSSVLTAISHACQHAINVKHGGIVSPATLYLSLIAESGERKTTVDSVVTKANRLHETRLKDATANKGVNYEASHAIWTAQYKGILARIRQAIREGADANYYKEELTIHLGKKPTPTNPPRIIYNDTNMEALLEGLHQSWASALLISAEGATVFGGQAMRGMDKLNVLWDGGDISKDRLGVSFTVHDARLTSSIMIQEKPFLHFMEKRGKMARGIGYLARNLVAYPPSTQGTRFIYGSNTSPKPHLALFHERISEILSTDNGKSQFKELEMSPEAYACWMDFYNRTEAELLDGRYLADVRDFGSKIAENAARIAALFHHYLGRDQYIQIDCVKNACEIAHWYACEFKDLFGKSQIPPEQIDAQMLEEWLWTLFRKQNNITPVPKQRIRTYGPNQLRNADRLNGALWTLASAGKITIGKQGKTDVIFPFINYFSNPLPLQPIYPSSLPLSLPGV